MYCGRPGISSSSYGSALQQFCKDSFISCSLTGQLLNRFVDSSSATMSLVNMRQASSEVLLLDTRGDSSDRINGSRPVAKFSTFGRLIPTSPSDLL